MRPAAAVLVALAITGAAPVAAEPPAIRSDVARIAGAILSENQTLALLEELVDRHGPRVTGTPSYLRSAEWAAAKLRGFGLQARLEPFAMPNLWQRGTARARIAGGPPLRVESLGWAPSTPRGGARGPVVVFPELTAEAVHARAAELRGKIALALPVPSAARRSGKLLARRLEALKVLPATGAAALLVVRGEIGNAVMDTGNGFPDDGGIAPMPMAAIALEDARLLERRAEDGPVTVEIELANRVSGAAQVPNVIAELRGEKPDEWIVVGAHLDSWDFATGAQDNGAGVAQVLDAARVLAAMGRPPRRSIRFALWGGEEQGVLGSAAWVRAHESELAGCIAVLNTDNGAGHPRGWKVEGRRDVEQALRRLTKPLAGLGADVIERTFSYDTDHGPFLLAGVPALDMLVEPGNYETIHHKAGDTVDKVTAHSLAEGAVTLAATAWAVANDDRPLAPRLDREGVAKLIEDQDYTEALRAWGVWK